LRLKSGRLLLELIRGFIRRIFMSEDFADPSFQLFLLGTHLCWGDIIVRGDLLNRFLVLHRLSCDTGFEFGTQVPSFSFTHLVLFQESSQRPAHFINKALAPFPEATSLRYRPKFPFSKKEEADAAIVDLSLEHPELGSDKVLELMGELNDRHGAPDHIRSDNGPEFMGKSIQQ